MNLLSSYCNKSTCTRQTQIRLRAHLLRTSVVTSRALSASRLLCKALDHVQYLIIVAVNTNVPT